MSAVEDARALISRLLADPSLLSTASGQQLRSYYHSLFNSPYLARSSNDALREKLREHIYYTTPLNLTPLNYQLIKQLFTSPPVGSERDQAEAAIYGGGLEPLEALPLATLDYILEYFYASPPQHSSLNVRRERAAVLLRQKIEDYAAQQVPKLEDDYSYEDDDSSMLEDDNEALSPYRYYEPNVDYDNPYVYVDPCPKPTDKECEEMGRYLS